MVHTIKEFKKPHSSTRRTVSHIIQYSNSPVTPINSDIMHEAFIN